MGAGGGGGGVWPGTGRLQVVDQEGDPRNFYDGRSISHLLRNNLLRVLKSATREPVVVVKFAVVYPS